MIRVAGYKSHDPPCLKAQKTAAKLIRKTEHALEIAIAYSRIDVAKYLLSTGADISARDYQGVYYAAVNSEIQGLQFAVEHGVDVNIRSGLLVNEIILAALNSRELSVVHWLIQKGANLRLITAETAELVSKADFRELEELVASFT